ncbi:MAG: DUF4232 domain-containing protein [Actinomycetota bacterium]|nr:DUF4232 domain-containing protein [Actinomycetota bacterium]
MSISTGTPEAGLSHIGLVFLLKNDGDVACQLNGYPGIEGVVSNGQQITAARSLSGFIGGVRNGGAGPVVDLNPGQTGSALVEGTDAPVGTATSCPKFTAFLVTPPNTRQTSRIAVSNFPYCASISVHPVVPGTLGRTPVQ